MKFLLNCLFFLLLLLAAVLAQIPKTMSYQGVLADTSGNAVADGNYNLTFKIYDVASGGNNLWMETQTLPVVDGIFNAILGSATPLNLPFDQPYWLGVAIGGSSELTPRIELTSAPFSLNTSSGSGGNTLDQAYDQGGPGVGRTITADAGPVSIEGGGGLTVNGPVGIGNANPTYKLEVGDNYANNINPVINIKRTGSGSASPLRFTSSIGDFYNIGVTKNSEFAISNLNQNIGLPSDILTIDSGMVGIGTTSPVGQLHVASHNLYAGYFTSDSFSYNTHVIHAEYNGATEDAVGVYGESVPAPTSGIGGEFHGGLRGVAAYADEPGPGSNTAISGWAGVGNNNNYGVHATAFGGNNSYGVWGLATSGSNNNYSVYASGNLAYTGNLINASDAKLKQNIRPLSGSLSKLMQLKPQTFNFTSDKQYSHMNLPTGEHYGLIAQEVEQVLPELVSDNTHPSAAESRGEKSDDPPISYKGLNSMEFIPILIEAVKEQQAIIEKQNERISQLEFKVNRLTNN